jgi:hypothetical protein
LNEPDSALVRNLINRGDTPSSAAWSLAEVSAVFHRYYREGRLTASQVQTLSEIFLTGVSNGAWKIWPVTTTILHRVALRITAMPPEVFLRAGDAVHLTTAIDSGETEVWTNDRHMLAAAPHFGLAGKSV